MIDIKDMAIKRLVTVLSFSQWFALILNIILEVCTYTASSFPTFNKCEASLTCVLVSLTGEEPT